MAYVADDTSGLQDIQALTQISTVSQVDATTFRVTAVQALAEGPYSLFIGPNVADTSGNLMDQDLNGVGGQPVRDVYAVNSCSISPRPWLRRAWP